METIRDLLDFLRCFDPSLPVNMLAVGGAGRSELVSVSAMEIVGPVMARTGGVASGVWLVGRTSTADVEDPPPESIGIRRSPCGCLVEIPLVRDQRIAMWGIECEHTLAVSSQ
jgi:hypothetical protein